MRIAVVGFSGQGKTALMFSALGRIQDQHGGFLRRNYLSIATLSNEDNPMNYNPTQLIKVYRDMRDNNYDTRPNFSNYTYRYEIRYRRFGSKRFQFMWQDHPGYEIEEQQDHIRSDILNANAVMMVHNPHDPVSDNARMMSLVEIIKEKHDADPNCPFVMALTHSDQGHPSEAIRFFQKEIQGMGESFGCMPTTIRGRGVNTDRPLLDLMWRITSNPNCECYDSELASKLRNIL